MEWWLGIIHPGDQTWVPAYCADQTSRGEEHSMEYRLMAKDGTIVWVNDLVTIEMLDGKPRIMRGVLVDITDRKLAEEALIKSKQLLKDTEKIGKVGGWEFNVDTKKQTWTDEVYNIHEVDLTYDMTVEKGIGFYTPESRPIIEQAVQRAIDYGVPFDVELEIITAKGNLRNVHAIGNLDLEHGRVYGFFQDITERKKAEEEKQALESQFQQTQKLESLGVLSGGIAHDFNNILAIIKGNCSLATMDSENTENYINEIDKASDRAAALCRQMLAYAGKAHLSMTQVNMWMLVDEMITMLKSTLPQNAVIKPGLQTNIPFITADASQIRQIVMNLIINASEAIGKEQGEIKVSLTSTTVIAGQADKDYHGKAIPPGIYVCLEVTDTGCGMDEATKKRIFEPFYTTKFTGRGLGMSAVLGIILSHKGALQLISQPGQGTTFKVYLPVQTGNSVEKEDQSQSVPDVPWQGSGTILLVEDEDQVRLIAKALLKNIGFTVLEAVNGKEALELYQRNATNIILVMTDMGMPVMDGYELFYELKKLKPGLPIIISSGFGDTEVSSRIGSDNIAGLISKPYNPDQLRGILKRVLEDEVTAVE